ncbi:alpha/beta-hydrolase [Daldinia caldariorum]|uniref:alpha/beta-hydrolase n=1 Tax=Daldinia caldariorum TaxID=326644 RepID=UPI002008E8E3|nr:alpha/beta-hydrolase [Daldinia caldariorum]KAI1469977.1 alpha/beta-hydrolase [Daldinia caldariorum]
MGDINIVEGTFEVDGVSLHTKSWLPSGPPKAKLVVVHGFSDHIDRYYDLFPSLARRGIAVLGFDQRGWGRSVRRPSDRGRSGPTATVLADLAAFIRERAFASSSADRNDSDNDDVPVFLLGHSMGGGEVLALASTPAYDDIVARIRGWILEAPFLGFAPAVQPRRLTVLSGRLAARVAPHFPLVRPVPPEHLCRDPAVQASLAADPLLHYTGTLEGLAGMIDRAEGLASGKLRLRPGVRAVFLAHGTADMVTSYERVREWWESQGRKVEDAKFKSYEGWAHQLHADPGKEEFYQDVGDWILQRAGGGGGDDGGDGGRRPEAKL